MKFKLHILINLFFIFCFFTLIRATQCQTRWEKRVGNTNRKEACVNINIDYDYGYMLSAVIYPSSGLASGLLIKTDINGSALWEKVITDNTKFFAIKNAVSNQGSGYLIVGYYQVNNNDEGPILIKLDSCGNKAWCNYFMNEVFDYGIYNDIMILDDRRILALSEMHKENGDHKIFLFCFSQEGELLWKKEYAKRQDYPEIYRPSVCKLYNFDNYYLISGHCYWAYKHNKLNWLTPMFIKIDSNFNEEWLLPFGYSDSLIGKANGIIEISVNDFMGYGYYYAEDNTKAVLMRFDAEGNETGYTIITDEQFNPPTNYNSIHDVWKLNDTLFIAGANFGPQMDGNPNGEYIFDLSGNIHQYNSRSGTWGPTTLKKTLDGNYLFGTTIDIGYQRDILLYKLNDSLESVPFDTIQYNYDSLCPDTILSGDISLDDCMIITGIDDIPSPEEFYAQLKTILIKAYPNPAKDKINFTLGNTDKHRNNLLECFNVFGRQLYKQKIYTGQLEAETDVTGWGKGMYFVVVRSNGKVMGKGKFVVE